MADTILAPTRLAPTCTVPQSQVTGLTTSLSRKLNVAGSAARLTGLIPSRSVSRQIYPSASAPTLIWNSDPANSFGGHTPTITSAVYAKLVDAIGSGSVSLLGAPPSLFTHPAGGFPNTTSYRPQNVRAPDVNGTTGTAWTAVEFICDAPQIEIWYINRGGASYRVWVDDQAIGSLTPTTRPFQAGIYESVTIDFTSVGGAKPHKIRFESTSDYFAIGMPIPTGYSATPYTISPSPQKGPLVVWLGDSLVAGSGMSTSGIYQIPTLVGEMLGWRVHNLGIGGTGYIVNNVNANTAPQQATYIASSYAATPPDIIISSYGHNDPSASAAAITTAVVSVASTLTAAFPNAILVFTGPLGAKQTNLSGFQATENAITVGLASYPNALFVSQWVGTTGWVLGTGTTRTVTDGVTNSTTTVTSATAAFAAGDVGKYISGGTIPAGTTIASRTNATTVVLSAAATGTASNVSLTLGMVGDGNADFYIGSDGTHWNDAGILYMAERFARELQLKIGGQ